MNRIESFDNEGTFIDLNVLKNLYNIKTNFLQYASVMSAIKSYLKKLDIKIVSKLQTPIVPYFPENILQNKKGCREFYDILQNYTLVHEILKTIFLKK